MVNRTGQESGLNKLDRRIAVSGDAPRVQYATESGVNPDAGRGLQSFGDVLSHISSKVEDRLDVQAAAQASREGTIAGRDGLPERQADDTIRGKAFNLAAQDAITIQSDLESRLALDEYEKAHEADPKAFRTKADAYIKGKLPKLEQFDPAMAMRLGADYGLRSNAAEGRIKDRQMVIIKDRQLENALRYQMKVQDEMAADAATLFTAGPQEATATITRMMTSGAKLIDSANMIGPDGRPMFSARERIAAERQAKGLVAEQISQSWIKTQPDMLEAFKTWREGRAEIELVGDDGIAQKTNLQTLLGSSAYQSATSSFMENLKSELSLNNQIATQQDRDFRNQSDQVFTDLSLKAQEGGLQVKDVEAFKSQLEPDKYLAIRTIAKIGGASVSDGAVYSELAIDDANGVDIRPRLETQYKDGKLSRDDYIKLFQQNAGRVDKGTTDPVSTGRDYLTQNLGVLSKEIGIGQSAAIGQATAEYQIEIQSFIDKEQRQPTHTEARDLAENVRARYSVLNLKDSLISMPLPQSMTQAEKLSPNLNTVSIEDKIKNTNQIFLEKYQGDAKARNNDPDYKREVRLLRQYHDILKMKEDQSAQRSNATK